MGRGERVLERQALLVEAVPAEPTEGFLEALVAVWLEPVEPMAAVAAQEHICKAGAITLARQGRVVQSVLFGPETPAHSRQPVWHRHNF